MSFYGNIKRVQSSPFVFDKYYPNRAAMEDAASTDNVYIGRYVLVKYTTNGEGTYFDKYTKPTDTNTQSVYTGYQENANKDITRFGDTFDGTVWQKIYTNVTNDGITTPIEKYIMVAELNAAVPRLDLTITSPKTITNEIETWNTVQINPEASSEDAYSIIIPDTLQLDVGTIDSNFYAKELIDDPSYKAVMKDTNGHTLTHEQMLSSEYNYMEWKNKRAIRDESGYITNWENSFDGDGPIDKKELDTKLYAFGQLISDLYDALYGVPSSGEGPRPFYTDNLSDVLANYDKGLVGILSSISTDMKGDASKDLYGRTLQPGMYYYFTSKWGSAEEDSDNFIENIPRVIGSTQEKEQNKCHYRINFTTGTLTTES